MPQVSPEEIEIGVAYERTLLGGLPNLRLRVLRVMTATYQGVTAKIEDPDDVGADAIRVQLAAWLSANL